MWKQHTHLRSEHGGVIINLCKAIFLITDACVNTVIVKFVLLTTNHYNLNIRSSQYISLDCTWEKNAGNVQAQDMIEAWRPIIWFYIGIIFFFYPNIALNLPLDERRGHAKLIRIGFCRVRMHKQTNKLSSLYIRYTYIMVMSYYLPKTQIKRDTYLQAASKCAF